MLGKFSCFCCRQLIFLTKSTLQKLIQEYQPFGSRSALTFFMPDLGVNCLQRLSAIDSSKQRVKSFGVAPITQYARVCNKNSNTHGSSLNMLKVIFHTLSNCPERKEFAPSGSKFFSLRESPILKRDIIVENHCWIQ